MNYIKDLNIRKELLPLFDYSLNEFTKEKILEILESPLPSVSEIKQRQKILTGLQSNNEILKDYSYAILYLNDAHFFLNNIQIKDFPKKRITYQLFTTKKEKIQNQNKFSLLILLFHRLFSKYFSRLNLNQFPNEYRENIERILTFLTYFELNKYQNIIREKGLKDKHVLELTEKISGLKKEGKINTFWEDFFLFEAYLSLNRAITDRGFKFPNFSKNGIELLDFYHPLLTEPVKNNIKIENNVIILNGPNMSGKSTFLKAVGLCIYLGHLGIGIPATSGEIPFFNHFFIKINRRDDLLNGYSHFMTEIVNLKSVIEKAKSDEKCFAIFDELFSGTNVEDAFEISKITLNGLIKFHSSYFFISTHIQQLKSISNNKISNFYLDCELINEKPVFTYKLKKGWSDIKVGRILFEWEGLNKLLTNK